MADSSTTGTSGAATHAPDGHYDAASYYRGEAALRYDQARTMSPFARRKWAAEETALTELLTSFEPGAVVLDMPCGTGRFDRLLAGRACVVLGADISLDMMRAGRRNVGPAVPRIQADGSCLPLPDQSIPYALCGRFLNLIPLPVVGEVLSELRRVVRSAAIVEVRVRRERPLDRGARLVNRSRHTVAGALRRGAAPTAAMPEREDIKVHPERDFIAALGAAGWRETGRSEAVYTRMPVRPDPLLFMLLEPM